MDNSVGTDYGCWGGVGGAGEGGKIGTTVIA